MSWLREKEDWMTARRALGVKLAEKADQAGGGKGWVCVKDVRAWGKTDGWRAEAKRLGVEVDYDGWYAAVLNEICDAGHLQRKSGGKYQKTGTWGEVLKMAQEFNPREKVVVRQGEPIPTPHWSDDRWLAAEILDQWPKDKKIVVADVKDEAAKRGGDVDAVGRAVSDFCCAYGTMKRVGMGRYEKLERWRVVTEALRRREAKKKKVVEEELRQGTITIHAGPMPATPDEPTPPTLPGFVSVKAPSVELVDTPIGTRPPAIITIDDLITHAEGLARQVVEWHGKYQQAVGMLRAKEADVEAAMRMLSDMEEQVMRKNVELEETKGELVTLQKQYEVAMDRARRAPIIPMINSRVTEEQGLDDDKPPTNGGGAAA